METLPVTIGDDNLLTAILAAPSRDAQLQILVRAKVEQTIQFAAMNTMLKAELDTLKDNNIKFMAKFFEAKAAFNNLGKLGS